MGMHLRPAVRWALALNLAAAGGLLPPSTAAAAEGTPCIGEYDLSISPGPSLTPGTGTYTTNGETGTITCEGSVDGRRITGAGTWGEIGRYGISRPYGCGDASGDFSQRTQVTLPTDRGPLRLVSDPLTGTFGPLQGGGALGGTITGPRFHGDFTFLPTKGDCVTAAVTAMHVKFRVWITD